MTARAQRIVDALLRAKGNAVTAAELAERANVEKVPTAIAEARKELGAPIETVRPRGSGYRLAPGWSPEDALPPPASPAGLKPLPDRAAKLLAMLERGAGEWVSGKNLSAPLGLDPSDLVPIIRSIRLKRPHLVIEGQRGRGYRLAPHVAAVGPTAEPPQPARATAPVKLPRARYPLHVTHRTAIELLQALHPATAEKVRNVALEAGETADEAIHRLLEYGLEVHHDLIAAGENPLQLGRAA